jgi:NAD(P)H-nitrite reductase large subunit
MKTIKSHVVWEGREEAYLQLQVDDQNKIVKSKLTGVGGPQFLQRLCALRGELTGTVADLIAPSGVSPEAILFRELILRAQGRWQPPYESEELCHCRAVPTAVVDRAICAGAHTSRQVSEQTSASTACGTCRPDVEAMIKWRLGTS